MNRRRFIRNAALGLFVPATFGILVPGKARADGFYQNFRRRAAAGGSIPITINGTPAGGTAENIALTIPYTITLAANGYVWIGATGWHPVAGHTINSATFDGTAMTALIANTVGGDANSDFRMFGLAIGSKAAGTYNAVITYTTGYDEVAGCVIVCDGVHQTTSVGTAVTATGTSTTPSVTVTTASGEFILDVVTYGTGTTTAGANQTERFDATDGADLNDAVCSSQAGADGGVMSWTLGTSQPWGIGAIPLKQANP